MESRRLQDAMRALQREAHTLDVRSPSLLLFSTVCKEISHCDNELQLRFLPQSPHHHSVLRRRSERPLCAPLLRAALANCR